jgi:ethanolamine transporter
MAGYSPIFVLRNLVPVIILAAVISLCLVFVPKIITKVFIIFGRIIGIIATGSCVTAIASSLAGITIIPDLGDISEAMGTVVAVVLVLPGAYVLVNIVSRLLKKPFAKLSGLLGVNEKATLGLLTTTANCIPTFSLIKDMDERGKVVNFAFLTAAGFLLGDHLAFCSAMDPALVLPTLVGKASAGISAVILALFMTRNIQSN